MFASQSFGASQGNQTIAIDAAGGFGSPAKKAARSEEKLTCLPVTVRMVQDAVSKRSDGGEVSFFGTEPGMLMLVGVVESVSQKLASLEFSLNDSTGRIHARHYSSGVEDQLEGIEAGRYVSIAAQLRTSPVVHLTVTAVRLMKSADEISYHMIEVAHTALKLQRASTSGGDVDMMTPSPKKHVVATGVALSPDKAPPVAAMPTVASIATAPVAMVAAAKDPLPQPLESEGDVRARARRGVLAFLQREGEGGGDEGVALTAICDKLAPVAKELVASILQQLVSDGDAFNTIDDDHFSAI